MRPFALAAGFFLLVCCNGFAQQKGYYRYPALHGNTLVFTAEGDLWKFDLSAGQASRLTTHSGMEMGARISSDGKQLAFVAEYEGPSELYVMDIAGGIPKRISYGGGAVYPSGYTADGKILYRTTAYSQLQTPQLVKIDPATLVREQIPLWQASFGCYDQDGVLYFTRFPNQGSKTKRYQGGFIEQVWKFDGKTEAVNLTASFKGTSTNPMYYKDRIYFLSDRDGTMNIWSMDKTGGSLKQQTFSKGWDLQSPAIDDSRIVYQKGADIWLYDINSNEEKLLDISLASDFDQRKPRWIKNPYSSITYTDISPNGNYAAIISRGRVFVSPSKSDRWVEMKDQNGIRFRETHFIDDKSIAVLSDKTGEFEVWKMNADGSDSAKQLTRNSKTLIKSFSISPDKKFVAYNDKNEVLRIAETVTGNIIFSYDSTYSGTNELSWSPNSRFLSFTRAVENDNAQICLIDTRNKNLIPLTTTRLNSYNPSWSADGQWLYFISERTLVSKVRAPWGSRQPEPYFTETANIYALCLDSAAKFPFQQRDSWLSDSLYSPVAAVEAAKDKKGKAKPELKKPELNYNWKQITQQLYQVPVKSANLGGMVVANGSLYWIDLGADGNGNPAKLFSLKMKEAKKYEPVEIASDIDGISLSADRKKLLLYFKNKTMAIADANGEKADAEKSKLALDNWSYVIHPQQDWKQMFDDAWRLMRDYFYDRQLHQVDWPAMKKQYEPLLTRITDRYELDDILSQMVGELSALHTFVGGGDKRRSPDQIPSAFLGARLTKTAKGEKIEHIYQTDPDYPENCAPLAKLGLRIKEGDIITAVDNEPLIKTPDIAALLINKANVPVKLSLLDKNGKAYEEVVKPCSGYADYLMRYNEWELTRREIVERAGKEDIGYIHLKAMGGGDMDDFVKQYYPIFNRKGLILDVRGNNGGNIDSWVLEKLMRKAWMYWQGRSGKPYWNMQYAFRGHMVILCDQLTASDGEAISEGFRRLGLGKVIGMRTWGGEIWLTGSNRLVDNGIATAAEFGVFGPEGKWLIEGHGVDPDIEVDNLPFETYKGRDAQLEYAINHLQKLIREQPVDVPPVPKHPDKSFKYPK